MSNTDKAVMQQALEFVEFCWRDVSMNAYASDKRDAIEAVLREAIAQPASQPETAWLIEEQFNTASPRWFIAGPRNTADFSLESNAAVRFSRRADAQLMLEYLTSNDRLICTPPNIPEFYKVTEHQWIGAPVAQPAEPEWIDDPHDIEQGMIRNPKWKPFVKQPSAVGAVEMKRYKIGYRSDEWGMRSSTPGLIPDTDGSLVKYVDALAAVAAKGADK